MSSRLFCCSFVLAFSSFFSNSFSVSLSLSLSVSVDASSSISMSLSIIVSLSISNFGGLDAWLWLWLKVLIDSMCESFDEIEWVSVWFDAAVYFWRAYSWISV